MQIIQKIKNWPPKKRFVIGSSIFIAIAIIIIILTLTSLGMTGSTFMVWSELQTVAMRQYLNNNMKWFFTSMQCLIAFDALLMIAVILLSYSVFNFYTKGNFIILIITGVLGCTRWGIGLWFLIASKTTKTVQAYDLINSDEGYHRYCQQSCGQPINWIFCQKLLMWGQLHSYQIGYLVMITLLGGLLGTLGKWVNQQDVKRQEGSSVNLQE